MKENTAEIESFVCCVCRRNWRVSWQLHVNRPTYIRRHSSTRMYACLLVHVVSEEEKAAFQIPRCSSGKDCLSSVAPGSIVMAASICSAKHLRIKLVHEVFPFSFLPSPFLLFHCKTFLLSFRDSSIAL